MSCHVMETCVPEERCRYYNTQLNKYNVKAIYELLTGTSNLIMYNCIFLSMHVATVFLRVKFDSTYRAFDCCCSLRQCDAISRWRSRLTGTLTEFLRLPGGSSSSCIFLFPKFFLFSNFIWKLSLINKFRC